MLRIPLELSRESGYLIQSLIRNWASFMLCGGAWFPIHFPSSFLLLLTLLGS